MDKRQLLTLTVLRQRVGLTQMDLALAIGKSQTEISHWEKGDRQLPADKAREILAVLRVRARTAIPAGITADDLSRPWDDVLLDGLHQSDGKSSNGQKRPRLRAPAGRAAAGAKA